MQQWIPSALVGLALAGSATLGLAQNTNPTNTFDTSASAASFSSWWGGAGVNATMAWDGTRDAGNDPSSGSVQYTYAAVGAAGEQFMTFFTIANRWGWDNGYTLDATTYTNLSFDIKVDPSSGQRHNYNDYGNLEVGLVTYTTDWFRTKAGNGGIPLAASSSWQHIHYPLNATMDNMNKVVGFYLYMWSNGDLTNTLTFNIDNFMITKPTAPVIIPPPSMTLNPKVVPGLNLLTTTASGQYGRQSIYSQADPGGNYYSWVNAAGSVTYSVTIKQIAIPADTGFQVHLFLIPNNAMQWGQGDTAGDWNATNVFWLDIKRGGADVRYKVNEGGGNTMLYNSQPGGDYGTNGYPAGHLGYLPTTDASGTWLLTFNNNTNITVTNPQGVSTNFAMPEADAMLFANPVTFYVGAQPNDVPAIGQSAVISHVKITGAAGALEDSFTESALDTTKWGKAAADAPAVLVVPPDSKYWLSWTLPDANFSLATKAKLGPGEWTDMGLTNTFKIGNTRNVLVPASALPSASSGYFALIKRVPAKLQVLLPGETNAPGTATGKIGTPSPQTVGNPFDLTINMCDATWHIVPASDTVSLTSTDPSVWLQNNATLANGTVTILGNTYFGSPGTWTITATDDTTPTITSGTSTSIAIP
jgi:hypothetical protein